MNENDYAVVIGVDHYPDFAPLNGAVNDAKKVHEWLLAPDGGALLKDNCKLIVSGQNNDIPIQDTIDQAFAEIIQKIGNTEGRRLYFYFSGHGMSDFDAEDIAMCLRRWSATMRRSAISCRKYRRTLQTSGRFAELVFWIDCCRIRNIRSGGMEPTFDWPRPADSASETRYFLGFATSYLNPSFEVEAGAAAGEEYEGIFTRVLLAGLKGGAAKDGQVTAQSLKEYLDVNVPRWANENNRHQTPDVSYNFLHDQLPIIGNAKKASDINVRFSFSPSRIGGIELVDKGLNPVHQSSVDDWPEAILLEPGDYEIIDLVNNESKRFKVSMVSGLEVRYEF